MIFQAKAARQRSLQLCVRSAELISNGVVTMQAVAQTFQAVTSARALRIGAKALAKARRMERHAWIAGIQALPLTPVMLLEIADEFRVLAAGANSPESRAAFQNLVFRYIALAGGCDSSQMQSRMVH